MTGRSLVVGGALVVTLVLVLWWLGVRSGDLDRRVEITNLIQLGSALLAAGVAAWQAVRRDGRARLHLGLLSLGALSWGLGQVNWLVQEVVLSRPVPFPSLGDAGFVLAYPLLIIAVVRAPSSMAHQSSRLRQTIDGMLVACALVFVAWAAGLDTVVGHRETVSGTSILSIVYPVGGVMLLTSAVIALLRARAAWRLSLALLASASALLALADGGFAYLTAVDRYASGSLIDAGWIAGWMVLAGAALTAPGRADVGGTEAVEPPGPLAARFPLAALGAVFVTAVVLEAGGGSFTEDPLLLATGFALFLIVAARSTVARAEGDALARELTTAASRSAELVTRYELALDAAALGTWRWRVDSGDVEFSPSLEHMLGMPIGSFGGTVLDLLGCIHPDDQGWVVTTLTEGLRSGDDMELQCRMVRRDGSELWALVRARLLGGETMGTPLALAGVTMNISDRRQADLRARAHSAQTAAYAVLGQRAVAASGLQEIFDDAARTVAETLGLELAGVLRLDEAGDRVTLVAGTGWSPSAVGAVHLSVEDRLLGGALVEEHPVAIEDGPFRFQSRSVATAGDPEVRSGLATRIRTSRGPWGVLSAHAVETREYSDDECSFLDAVAAILGAAIDRAAAEDELRHRSLHDSLTDLPNRALLRDRLHVAVQGARRAHRFTAVVHIGIDGFTLVNDSYGTEVGDEVLRVVAGRLDALCSEGDTAARHGGDEFVVATVVDHPHDALRRAEQILAELSRPIAVSSMVEEIFLSPSLGVSVANGGGDPDSLLQHAATAQARAAARGGRRYELFDESLRTRSVQRLRVEQELRQGLELGEIEAHYQPVVRLRDGAIVAVEALARWRHPTRGLLEPIDFIEVAEASGLVRRLGEVMLDQATRAAATWNGATSPPIQVAVNISTAHLAEAGFVDQVRRTLQGSGAPAEMLCLEILETALVESEEKPMAVLQAVKRLGAVSVCVDDFGTGHSSLARLKHFPVDGLKIDRMFTANLADDATDRAIAEAIIHLGHTLGLRVVAEGVEDRSQLRILDSLGCDLVQGWLFDRAMSKAAMDRLIERAPTAYAHVIAAARAGSEARSMTLLRGVDR